MLSIRLIENFIATHIEGVKPSVAELQHYRSAIGADHIRWRINSPQAASLLQRAVVFISDRPNYFFLRVSLALRKIGIKTICLSRWGVEKQQESFFDHILLYDKISDLKSLQQCQDCMLYVQSWVGWNFLPVYVQFLTGQRVACNINDLLHLLFDAPENGSLIGLSPEEIEMDIRCERYILENFSFVTVPYNLTSLNTIDAGLRDRLGHQLVYSPCYPAPSFFAKREQTEKSMPIHLVFIGGIPPDHKPDAVFGDAKLHDVVDELLQSPFHVTIFNNPQLSKSRKTIEALYPHFTQLSGKNSHFEFRDGYPPWELHRYMAAFHYGLMVYGFENLSVSRRHFRNIVPTKFFTYMELGIPVIVVDEMQAVSDIVRQHHLGVVISKKEISSLYQKLMELIGQYDLFVQSVEAYRRQYGMDKMVAPIVAFFQKKAATLT